MSTIGFSFKPSVGYLILENMELDWIHKMDKNHDIFRRFSSVKDFDYYFIDDILIIPDPARVVRNKRIFISDLEIECEGNFLVFFNYHNLGEGLIYANSLKLPQFQFLKSCIQWEK